MRYATADDRSAGGSPAGAGSRTPALALLGTGVASGRDVIRNAPDFTVWPNDTVKEWARHEAGHAVAMVRRDLPFSRVSVREQNRRVHVIDRLEGFESTDFTAPSTIEQACAVSWDDEAQQVVWTLMITMAAGPLAQVQYEDHDFPRDLRPFTAFGGRNDAGWIDGYALGLAALRGGDVDEIVTRKEQLIEDALREAFDLVRQDAEVIESVARALERQAELTHDQVVALVADA